MIETRSIPSNPANADTILRQKFNTFQPMVSRHHDLCQNNTQTNKTVQNGFHKSFLYCFGINFYVMFCLVPFSLISFSFNFTVLNVILFCNILFNDFLFNVIWLFVILHKILHFILSCYCHFSQCYIYL